MGSGGRDNGREALTVDAFSQLPFIRSAPSKTAGAIRLFGIEVPHEADDNSTTGVRSSSVKDNEVNSRNGDNLDGGNGDQERDRKFECHYCCRNFPTSQALGGHQNAHKRERQQAKRAHLHSAIAAHYQNSMRPSDAQLYGLLNYHSINPIPSSTPFAFGSRPGHAGGSIGDGGNYMMNRFYGGPRPVTYGPINGNPVPEIWRGTDDHRFGNLQPIHRDRRSSALPLLGDGNGSLSFPSMPLSSPPNVRESSGTALHEHVSLDLRL